MTPPVLLQSIRDLGYPDQGSFNDLPSRERSKEPAQGPTTSCIQSPPWQSEVASDYQGGTYQSNAWYTRVLFEYESLAYR